MSATLYMCLRCREEFRINNSPSVPASVTSGTVTEAEEPGTKKTKLSSEFTTSGAKSSHCYTCLGILEIVYLERLVEEIALIVEKGEYRDLDTFHCCVSVPLSLLVRRAAIVQLLRHSLGDAKFRTPDDSFVKEGLKTELNHLLGRRLHPMCCTGASPFEVNVKLDHVSCGSDCSLLSLLTPELKTQKKRRRKRNWDPACDVFYDDPEYSSQSIKARLATLTPNKCVGGGLWQLQSETGCTHSIGFSRKPLYLGGRYCKYSRNLSQTPWVIEGVKKCDTSVEELICGKLAAVIRSSAYKFCSSGREDVDVRMLGEGRPFVVEFCNPKRVRFPSSELAGLQEAINSSTAMVEVRGLSVIAPEALRLLKDGEEEKMKTYAALIWTRLPIMATQLEKLESVKKLVVRQRTPIRVLHRRTLATRERTIHALSATPIDAHHFKLTLVTQAGTYIKEFVHGDLGRTQPCLGTLLECELDIVALDVMKVSLDWPPPSDLSDGYKEVHTFSSSPLPSPTLPSPPPLHDSCKEHKTLQ